MNRTPSRSGQSSGPLQGQSFPRPHESNGLGDNSVGTWWDISLIRALLAAGCVVAGYHFHPFNLTPLQAGGAGLGLALAVFLFERRLRRASLRRLIGAAVGSILGILGAYLMYLVLDHTSIPVGSRSFLGVAVLLVMTYIGLVVGAKKGDMLNLQAFGGLFGNERSTRRFYKIFDTSVIIDGRVADICETNFLDGTLLLPQFVLHELQLVADSSDPLKRQRGRRGLEVLQRIQKMSHLDVQIIEDDFTNVQEVDMKLIELAKRYDAKIVTNDYNLNKVATVQGIGVLNVNQLANALKPVVLPGESMRVFILREGKEYNQGVAYLDDGTMVVVDGARRMINKTIDISVTSVHQTTAGKMIFGRWDDRAEQQGRAQAPTTEGSRETVVRSAEAHPGGERPPRPISPESGRE
jgi:uncharacterized protein YacL